MIALGGESLVDVLILTLIGATDVGVLALIAVVRWLVRRGGDDDA